MQGKIEITDLIKKYLAFYLERRKGKNAWSDVDIDFFIKCFYEDAEFSQVTMQDVLYFLHLAAKGEYGVDYNNNSPTQLLMWFRDEYQDKRGYKSFIYRQSPEYSRWKDEQKKLKEAQNG